MKSNDELPTSAPTCHNTMLGAVHFRPAVKVCSNCKETFEKNSGNFFEKQDKYKLVDGTFKVFKKLTSVCKKCHSILTVQRRRLNKIKEYGCSVEDYEKTWKKRIGEKNCKIPEAVDSPHYRMILHSIKMGYDFISLEQYEKDRINNVFVRKRCKNSTKLKYFGDKLICELPKEQINSLRNEYNNEVLPRAVIANRLGLKLNDCPNQVIETQRLIIKINQILNKK